MDKTRWDHIKDLLNEVVALPAGAAREDCLGRAGVSADIKAEVLMLAAAHDHAEAGPADPSREGHEHHAETAAPAGSRSPSPSGGDVRPGDPAFIGKYRVLKRLGGGGMGVVYMAVRDDEQFQRRVAVKLIKKGMDSEAVLKRFELEKQVLATLKHSNIGGVIDAGMAEDGRPYFVMEYVEGQTILEYCDSNQLTIEDRLKLFMKVCSAVHAAHQNLVVHRDIKPGNILVGVDGEPKLLDFGIAKLLNPGLIGGAGMDVFTGNQQRLMTPEYASPEQVKGEPITTSSDVYSLGVLLYELLTGIRPYSFRSRLEAEIIRVIAEEEPQRPSTAVSLEASPTAMPTTGMSTGTVDAGALKTRAKLRSTKPDTLKRELTNDIDDIVLMAMRKSPKRRYASAEQMAEDIRRHLTGQTVIARPDTMGYVAGKFVRRHRAAVAVGTAFVLLVAASAIVMGWMWQRAAHDRNRADENARVANAATELAKQKAAEAQDAKQRALAARDQSLAVIQGFLTDVLKKVRNVPGALEARKAIAEQSRGFLDSLATVVPPNLAARRNLGTAYLELHQVLGGLSAPNQGDRAAALEAAQQAVRVFQECEEEAADDRDNLIDLAWAWHYVADAQLLVGQPARVTVSCQQAVDAADRAYSIAARDPGQGRLEAAVEARALAQHLIADRMLARADAAGAEALLRSTLDGLRENTNRRPENARVWGSYVAAQTKIARCRAEIGDQAGALEIYHQALAQRMDLLKRFPRSSSIQREVPITRERVGNTLSALSRHDEAERELRAAVGEIERLLQDEPDDARLRWDSARISTSLARCLFARGVLATPDQLREASSLVAEAIQIASGLGPGINRQESLAEAKQLQGELLLKQGQKQDARTPLAESAALWRGLREDDSECVSYRRRLDEVERLEASELNR